jgi:hypothetical protein
VAILLRIAKLYFVIPIKARDLQLASCWKLQIPRAQGVALGMTICWQCAPRFDAWALPILQSQ